MSKLRSLPEAVARRESLGSEGKVVVLTNGVFDLLHPGHVHFLSRAAELGGALFIALNADESVRRLKGPDRPIEPAQVRAAKLSELPFVDTVVLFHEVRLTAEIRALHPDVYCKAGDYTLDKLNAEERAELERAGVAIQFLSFLPGHSTTSIIAQRKAAASQGSRPS